MRRQSDKDGITAGAPELALPLINPHLLTTFVVTSMDYMTNADRYKNWFSSMSGKRITAQDIADKLNISRNATNSRMAKGLTADDIITIARGFEINPVIALQELGHVSVSEIFDYLDDGGKSLATATPEELVYHLAQDILGADQKLALVQEVMGRSSHPVDELAARRKSNTSTPVVESSSYDSGMPDDAVADSSPEVGGTPDDYET